MTDEFGPAEQYKTYLPVTVDLYTWISVIGMLQLALRHPDVQGSIVADRAEQFTRALEVEVAKLCPEAAEVIAKGWDPAFDEPMYDQKQSWLDMDADKLNEPPY